MNEKRNVVLYLDTELVRQTRELGFNLSKTVENHFKTLINQLSTLDQENTNEKQIIWCGGREFRTNLPVKILSEEENFNSFIINACTLHFLGIFRILFL